MQQDRQCNGGVEGTVVARAFVPGEAPIKTSLRLWCAVICDDGFADSLRSDELDDLRNCVSPWSFLSPPLRPLYRCLQ